MDEKDKHDSKLTTQSKSRRSIFDFSSVEDLRQTDSDLVPSDKTQPKIPFNTSYIAHAPSRHLFTLNSRYTYFGGYGVSSKENSGSVEDLSGYTRSQKRHFSLSKFSKSSPDLFGASYQSSDGDDVTEQETHEDFVTKLDIETNLESESGKRGDEHRNDEHGNGSKSVTETEHENDTKLRTETKWATKTENEENFQLTTNTFETTKQSLFIEVKNEFNATASIFEKLDTNDEIKTTQLPHSGADDDSLVSQISVSKNNDDEHFDKGWQTILHSGKADLKKSLENLNLFREDMNSRDNVDASGGLVDTVEPQESLSERMILKRDARGDIKETGMKRNDEIAGLNMNDLIRSGKQQKVSQENFTENQSSSSDSNTKNNDKQRNYSKIILKGDSKWTTSLTEVEYTTDVNHITSHVPLTANRNEEKQAALSIIDSQNDNFDLCTSKEHAAVCESSPSSEMFQTNYNNISTSKAPKTEGNYDISLGMYNSTVLHMEETSGFPQVTDDQKIPSADKTVKSEGSSAMTMPPSCNISPISFRVLNTSCDENIVWQNTEEFREKSTNATVKVSEIQQSSIFVTEDDKNTVDCDQSLHKSFETPNKTKDNSESHTIEEEKQPAFFNNVWNQPLSNSTHESNNDWLNNTTETENANSIDLPKESADNSLIKNMMGMFCLLGFKDSPQGGFYSNGDGRKRKTDISNVEQELCMKEIPSTKSPSTEVKQKTQLFTSIEEQETQTSEDNLSKDIKRKLVFPNEYQAVFKDNDSFNDIETESLINYEQQDKGVNNVGTESDDFNNTNGEELRIQQITLYESLQASFEGNVNEDYHSGSSMALEEDSICDKDLLLNIEPDKTLRVSDIENGKQEKSVDHRNTEEIIDKRILLQTTTTQDLLFQTPEDSELAIQNEVGDFQEDNIVELNMRENRDMNFTTNTADLLMTRKGLRLSQENTNKQSLKNIITTTNLEINRNKWSHAFIIINHARNVYERFSGAFNVLVLDSELKPTSPERKPTLVTLKLFPHETDNSRRQSVEVSEVNIQMNAEKDMFCSKENESNFDPLQETDNKDISSNNVEEQVIQSNPTDNNLEQNPAELEIMIDQDNSENEILTPIHERKTTVYLENEDTKVNKVNEIQQSFFQKEGTTTNITFTGKVHERSLPDSGEKDEIINDPVLQTELFYNMQADYFAKLESDYEIQETVHKVDVNAMKDRRLSEHLMCFEMDELIEEKITKQGKTEQESLFSELDGILPENEIQETLTKEETRGVQYGFFSEVDELFTSVEEMKEHETEGVVKCLEENNTMILSQVNDDSLSELTTQKVVEETQHLSLSQSEKDVPEVITKAVEDSNLQYLSQFDDVLKPEYVQEIVSNKVEAQHEKQNYLLETDKYFDSIETVQQPMTEKINSIPLEQSSELAEQRTDPGSLMKYVEKSMTSTSALISFQHNEVEIVQEETDRNDGGLYVKEEDLKEDTWKITFNDKEVLPAKEVVSTPPKDNGLNNNFSEELILVISQPKYPMNSVYLHGEDDSSDDSENNDNDDGIRQCTVSPTPDDISSITSNYDASAESSCESAQNYTNHQRREEDCLIINHNVPWNVTVSYSNPDTMKSECKILRASYSNIQPEVYHVENKAADVRVTFDSKANSGRNGSLPIEQKRPEISEQLHTTTEAISQPITVHYIENNLNINTDVTSNGGTPLDEGNQYRTTMDIKQNRKNVNTSYVLFQRFGEQKSPRTYFELNYDMDKWKVGEKISSRTNDDPEKTFVVSYATIEKVNHPQTAFSVYLPTIEEDEIYEEDICGIQATPLSNESEQIRIEFLQQSPPPASSPQSPSLSPLPPPPSHTPPQSPPTLFLPLPTTTTACTSEFQEEERNIYTLRYSPPEDLSPGDTPYPLIPPAATNSVAPEEQSPVKISYPPSQAPPETPREEVELVETDHNPQQVLTPEIPSDDPDTKITYHPSGTIHLPTPPTEDIRHVEINHRLPAPLEASPEDLRYESLRTIQSQVPPTASESRPPVWSFAQSVFHTDGQSKTFFKVIDNRKKSFQSSTFMYRGERVKVSRGVNVFKNYTENWKQDIGDEENEGYSEIWDDGNLTTADNQIMMEADGPVTTSTVAYEMATEEDLFNQQESRNCSWHLNIHGAQGVCKISPDSLDAIAVENDNTLLGSQGFSSGQHKWVIQGLGIFCAVGICYPQEEVGSWYNGGKWVWTTDGLKYSEPTGIRRSEFGQWRNEDVLVISLDCEEQKLTIVNTRTNVEAILHGFKGEVCPYFNIYKGSSIRLIETTVE